MVYITLTEEEIRENIWDNINTLLVEGSIASTIYAEYPDEALSYPIITLSFSDINSSSLTMSRGKTKFNFSCLITIYDVNPLVMAQKADDVCALFNNNYSAINSRGLRNIHVASSPITTTIKNGNKVHVCNIGIIGDALL